MLDGLQGCCNGLYGAERPLKYKSVVVIVPGFSSSLSKPEHEVSLPLLERQERLFS